MSHMPPRIVLHARDVQNITGFGPKSSQRLLRVIREKAGIPPGGFVTVYVFCEYTGINVEHVLPFLA
jgi:hypothetical protein